MIFSFSAKLCSVLYSWTVEGEPVHCFSEVSRSRIEACASPHAHKWGISKAQLRAAFEAKETGDFEWHESWQFYNLEVFLCFCGLFGVQLIVAGSDGRIGRAVALGCGCVALSCVLAFVWYAFKTVKNRKGLGCCQESSRILDKIISITTTQMVNTYIMRLQSNLWNYI